MISNSPTFTFKNLDKFKLFDPKHVFNRLTGRQKCRVTTSVCSQLYSDPKSGSAATSLHWWAFCRLGTQSWSRTTRRDTSSGSCARTSWTFHQRSGRRPPILQQTGFNSILSGYLASCSRSCWWSVWSSCPRKLSQRSNGTVFRAGMASTISSRRAWGLLDKWSILPQLYSSWPFHWISTDWLSSSPSPRCWSRPNSKTCSKCLTQGNSSEASSRQDRRQSPLCL